MDVLEPDVRPDDLEQGGHAVVRPEGADELGWAVAAGQKNKPTRFGGIARLGSCYYLGVTRTNPSRWSFVNEEDIDSRPQTLNPATPGGHGWLS